MVRMKGLLTIFTIFLAICGCVSHPKTIAPFALTQTTSTITSTGKPVPPPSATASQAAPYPIPYSILDTPIPYPPPVASPTLRYSLTPTLIPSHTPTPTLTPSSTSTATLSPYSGQPFPIVFIRDGDLWLANIGRNEERPLTHEPVGWSVDYFDINWRGDRIAYITLKGDHPDVINAMIKQVDLRTGVVSPLVGMDDGLIEDRVKWLDDTHLAYEYNEYWGFPVETSVAPTPTDGYYPYDYFVLDLTSGNTTRYPQAVDISQSPDGRFLLTCLSSYPYEPNCKFSLRDLVTSQTQPAAEDTAYGWFRGWSADGKWMLFTNSYVDEQKFLIVDPISRQGRWVPVPGERCESISWATQSEAIACTVCVIEAGCQVHFWGPDGNQDKPPIPLPQYFSINSWTPDDSRLVLFSEDRTLWVIKVDGTGLQRIFDPVQDWYDWAVLLQRGE